MTGVDVDRVSEIVQDVAARVIVPRFRALAHGDVRQKARGDVVTVADLEAEREITQALEALLPGVPVLGEEAAAADPALAVRVQAAPRYWVLDPLDGTSNFVAGRPDLGTMVALVDGEVTVAGWIWQPLHQDLYVAELGSGSFRNGTPIVPRPVTTWDPAASLGYTHTAFFGAQTAARIDAAAVHVGTVTRGPRAACVTYPRLATGSVTFSLFGRTHVWDHAPGVLMVTEAGGAARRFDGTLYAPGQTGRGLLITARADHWQPIADRLGLAGLGPD